MTAVQEFAELIIKVDSRGGKKAVDNLEDLQREGKKAEKVTDQLGRTAKRAFAVLGGGFAVGFTLNKIISETRKQEDALAQLNQAFETTGETALLSADKLTAYAAELQSVTTFADDDFISAAAQLRTFTGIIDEEFTRTLEIAGDLSVHFDQDLKSSVLQLGKALNDPIANLGALSRSGIQFSEEQKDLIKTLAETGRMAEAQQVILAELDTQFGGSARAARNTFGGALAGLQNTLGDMLEADGDSLPALTGSINDLNTKLSDPALQENIQSLAASMLDLVGLAADLTGGLLTLGKTIGETFAAAVGGPAIDDLDRLISRHRELKSEIAEVRASGILNFSRRSEIEELQDELSLIEDRIKLSLQEIDINQKKRELTPLFPKDDAEPKNTKLEGPLIFEETQRRIDLDLAIDNEEDDLEKERNKRKELAKIREDDLLQAIESEQAYTDEIAKQEEARTAIKLAAVDVAGNVFGTLAQFAKEGSTAQRVLLAAEKAAAIARSAIALQLAIAKANELGFPSNIPAIASATAIGAGAISTLKGVNVSGQFDNGGTVPYDGTFFLKKDEEVITSDQAKEIRTGGMKVVVNNNAPVQVSTRQGPTREELIVDITEQVKSELSEDFLRGDSEFTDAYETGYGAQRVAR